MKGTVKFFNTSKGFGFIVGEDGKEYFVHSSALPAGFTPKERDAVSFDLVQGDRGPKAANVKVGGAHAAKPAPAEDSDDVEGSEGEADDEDADEEEEQ